MLISPYSFLDTPVLLIDKKIMHENIEHMQKKANELGVALRPHTKTHKMAKVAKMQLDAGAQGITVAKVGEAEAMYKTGIRDIFIANEIIGEKKWKRIIDLTSAKNIIFGVDNAEIVKKIDSFFSKYNAIATVRVEVETGENRSGITSAEQMLDILKVLKKASHVKLDGIFSHEGHCYNASSIKKCEKLCEEAQRVTLHYAQMAKDFGLEVKNVSVGSTPSILHAEKLLPGITEIRPGTYVLMDVGQGNSIGTYSHCAASILTTIISKPTDDRVIGDAGAKALTKESRDKGICKTQGKGFVKESENVYVDAVYDEHTIINNKRLHDAIKIGDKIEIIPNHICPTCNLYDEAYLVLNGKVVDTINISARGKIL